MSWSPRNSLLLAFLLGSLPSVVSADISAPRQAELGVLLKQDCGSCHGLTRRGGLGSPLLPGAIAHFTDDALIEIILDGVPGTPMPPWRPFLTPGEAAWMVNNLRKGVVK